MRTVIVSAVLAAAALARPASAAPAVPPLRVAETEVSFKDANTGDAAVLAEQLRAASAAEAGYYDPALPAAVMRIRVDKIGYKSAGKALAQNLPLVGMFSGRNENVLKGEVQLVDRASGRVLAKYRIACDDYTDFSAADAAGEYGKMGLSFLPFGGLISAAVEVGEGAASRHDQARRMLTRGFVMLSYQKAYGNKLYRSFTPRRKAAWAAERAAGRATPGPAAPAITAAR